MIEMSADLDKIAPALHAAQGIMTGAVKDAKNPHFKNNYATLEAVVEAARPGLQANGLSVTQAPASIVDGSLTITTMLLHASGQWLRSTLHVPLGQKRDAQAVGSAISYGRRYALMAVLGLPSVDDDGQAAVAPAPRQEPPQQKTQPVRQQRETGTVQPAVRLEPGTPEWREALFEKARAKAAFGNDALNKWWGEQSRQAQAALEEINPELDDIVNEAASRREAAE